MSSGRPNWYYDHPPACTCAACNERRLARGSTGKKFRSWLKRVLRPFSRRRK